MPSEEEGVVRHPRERACQPHRPTRVRPTAQPRARARDHRDGRLPPRAKASCAASCAESAEGRGWPPGRARAAKCRRGWGRVRGAGCRGLCAGQWRAGTAGRSRALSGTTRRRRGMAQADDARLATAGVPSRAGVVRVVTRLADVHVVRRSLRRGSPCSCVWSSSCSRMRRRGPVRSPCCAPAELGCTEQPQKGELFHAPLELLKDSSAFSKEASVCPVA